MPKKRDLNTIAELERAIAQKYGKEAIQHPRSNWNEEKEKEYLEQLKKLSEKEDKTKEKVEKIEKDGFLISKKLLNKESERSCPVCKIYSFDIKDGMYMVKFSCCFQCYVEFVGQREERWKSGWRPNKDEINKRRFSKDD
tara:strand:- start:10 stop:429 length:420 start_codon:yes stop_codon:yes gene_type:complete